VRSRAIHEPRYRRANPRAVENRYRRAMRAQRGQSAGISRPRSRRLCRSREAPHRLLPPRHRLGHLRLVPRRPEDTSHSGGTHDAAGPSTIRQPAEPLLPASNRWHDFPDCRRGTVERTTLVRELLTASPRA
jgi:hypothetical protein